MTCGRALAAVFGFGVSLLQAQTLLPPGYTIGTIAGTSYAGDGGKAVNAPLAAVEGLTTDSAGNVYLSDAGDHRVRKIGPTGTIVTLAGNGAAGLRGDKGPSNEAQLNQPYGLAVDPHGQIYIADLGNQRIRRIGTDGAITTVAGGGETKPPGEGGEALATRFQAPRNVVVDPDGNLYVSDFGDNRVYRITPSGGIAVAAGTGVAGFTEKGEALNVNLSSPSGLALDAQGALYIADSGNKAIRKLAAGKITTVLGGSERSVPLDTPTGLAVDRNGTLYVADGARLYQMTSNGQVTSIATGARDVAADKFGNVYFSKGPFVYKLSGTAAPVIYAGDGSFGVIKEMIDAGLAYLQGPTSVALDDMGNLYIAEQLGKRVRRVTSAGIIYTYAGGGTQLGDNLPAEKATLYEPAALAFDAFAGLHIADSLGSRVRGVDNSGTIRTVAGDGEYGFKGDSGPAAQARVNKPAGVAFDRSGNEYIADTFNNRVRKIGSDGNITTYAGTGVRGYYGDGGNAKSAQLSMPQGLACDALGNLYIADTGNNVIRKIGPTGVITTIAGSGVKGFSGDNGSALVAAFNGPSAIAVDTLGAIYVADRFNNRVRRVSSDGIVTTIAGDGSAGMQGDGGPALSARLNGPSGIATDSRGNIYIADTDNNRIRKLTPSDGAGGKVPESSGEPLTVMNAASFRTGPVAPGAIISIFGSGIGPIAVANGKLNAAGRLDVDLSGTQVRFDGVAAPLFFASAGQINLQVPYDVTGKPETEVEVIQGGTSRGKVKVAVASATPGLFTMESGVGQVVAVNEDGTLNSSSNPATRGSVVVLYATGEGQTSPGGVSGTPAAAPLPRPIQDVQLTVGTSKAEILWAGSAPGFVGLLQINVKLPGMFTPPGVRPLTLTVGAVSSQAGVTIAVK
ncbi:MAG: hypothetical protein IT168_17945 [Bryobacterales bacterium]|nr:hypothetical protein [Bryobacterales bacterium]